MAAVKPLQPTAVGEVAPESTTKITADVLLSANENDKQALVNIQELLNLIFVRNRNQHHRSHWFKSLSQFRKQLTLLLQEMEGEKKSAISKKLQARLQFWDEECVHQWYLHFTQVMAVGSFAVLGLVLMACTARVCRITGVTALYEQIASDDMKIMFESMDEDAVEDEFGRYLSNEPDEDEGEIVERTAIGV